MIIGLVGFIGSGKGTAGDIIAEMGYTQESFAKPVKDIVSMMFGWDRTLLEGDTVWSRQWREEADEYWSGKFGHDFSPRLALQLMGTEVGRQIFHNDFWVYSMENRLNSGNVVITDVRFPNEINWITNNNNSRRIATDGIVLEIQRGQKPGWYEIAKEFNNSPEEAGEMPKALFNTHYSEWAWVGHPGIYKTIHNDGTLADLKKNIKEALTSYHKEKYNISNEPIMHIPV